MPTLDMVKSEIEQKIKQSNLSSETEVNKDLDNAVTANTTGETTNENSNKTVLPKSDSELSHAKQSQDTPKPDIVSKSPLIQQLKIGDYVKVSSPESDLLGHVLRIVGMVTDTDDNLPRIYLEGHESRGFLEEDLTFLDLDLINKPTNQTVKVFIQGVILSDDGKRVIVEKQTQRLPEIELTIGKTPDTEMANYIVTKYKMETEFVEVSNISVEDDCLYIVYHVKVKEVKESDLIGWANLDSVPNSTAKLTLDKIIERIRRWQSSAKSKASQIAHSIITEEIQKIETKYSSSYETKIAQINFEFQAEFAKIMSQNDAKLKSQTAKHKQIEQELSTKILELEDKLGEIQKDPNIAKSNPSTQETTSKKEDSKNQKNEEAKVDSKLEAQQDQQDQEDNVFETTRQKLFAPSVVDSKSLKTAVDSTHETVTTNVSDSSLSGESSRSNYKNSSIERLLKMKGISRK